MDSKKMAQLEKLRKEIEAIAGKDAEVSLDQFVHFIFPIASHTLDDGQVTLQRIFFPGRSCSDMRLLDVAGTTSTGADGKRVFLLSSFICATDSSFDAR